MIRLIFEEKNFNDVVLFPTVFAALSFISDYISDYLLIKSHAAAFNSILRLSPARCRGGVQR